MSDYKNNHMFVEEYIKDAIGWLEDAETALSIFIDKADPQNEDAETNLNAIMDIHSILKKFIKQHEGIFEEIIYSLPAALR